MEMVYSAAIEATPPPRPIQHLRLHVWGEVQFTFEDCSGNPWCFYNMLYILEEMTMDEK